MKSPRPPRAFARTRRARPRQHPENGRRRSRPRFGQLDILVNNAGCNVRKPALEVTWDDWNMILDTNLRGSFFVAQAVARGMIAARLWPHHQHRLRHQRRRLRRPRPLRRQPRRHQATHHEPRRRLGQTRHHRQLPRPRLVQDRTKQNPLRRQGWVEYLCDRIPVKRPGQPNDLDVRRRLPRLRLQPLHHRPNPACRRRHLHQRHPCAADSKTEVVASSLTRRECFEVFIQPRHVADREPVRRIFIDTQLAPADQLRRRPPALLKRR